MELSEATGATKVELSGAAGVSVALTGAAPTSV